jgi:hypothetical protein
MMAACLSTTVYRGDVLYCSRAFDHLDYGAPHSDSGHEWEHDYAPKYWVLMSGAESDTPHDYVPTYNRADCVTLARESADWAIEPGAHVFAGSREPWTEEDPYPDFTVTRGARGGYRWEVA